MSCPALLEVPVETGEFVLSAPQTRALLPCIAGDEELICPMTGKNECPTNRDEQAKCPSC